MSQTWTPKRRARARTTTARRIADPALLAAAVVAAATGTSSATLTKAPSDPGVCAGVARCHVVARADVNGDGARDVIGIARRGAEGAPHGAVLVRVKTGPGKVTAYRAATEYWYGPVWQGVAPLDGRKGSEIVVGRLTGAHSQLYRALTWRDGRLVTLDAPGRGRFWYIDSAVWISAGWQHRAGDPDGTIRRRVAERSTTGPTVKPFKGTVTTFTWTTDGWKRTGSKTYRVLSDAKAASWGGFQVPGLDRW